MESRFLAKFVDNLGSKSEFSTNQIFILSGVTSNCAPVFLSTLLRFTIAYRPRFSMIE